MKGLLLYTDEASALRLALLVAAPARRELFLELTRAAHGDARVAIDTRPELPTALPDPAAGGAETQNAGNQTTASKHHEK